MTKKYLNSDDINAVFKLNINRMNYSGASIDSRVVLKKNIFFALKGSTNDGHNFLEEAKKKGASIAIVEKINKKIDIHQIKVKNTHNALIQLAKYYRKKVKAKILGITGSVGKTSTKDAIANILSLKHKTFASRKSYNNIFGVPVEILNMPFDSEYGVFEIGMNQKNEISKLTKILMPEIVCVLNVNYVHGGNFNSLKKIALAKSEITNSSKGVTHVILNNDCKFYTFIKNQSKKNYNKTIISFGYKKNSDIRLSNKAIKHKNYKLEVLIEQNKVINYQIKKDYEYLISNTLAMIACFKALNVSLGYIKKYKIFDASQGRGNSFQIEYMNRKIKVFDHSYNASPVSFLSTINAFNNNIDKDKLFIIGEMFELGNKRDFYHKKILDYLQKINGKYVFLIGDNFKRIMNKYNNKSFIFIDNVDVLINCFKKYVNNNSLIYIKGSNKVNLKKFVSHLKESITV